MKKTETSKFLLLLWEGITNPDLSSDESERRVCDWLAWIKSLNIQSQFVDGHHLKRPGKVLKGRSPVTCTDLASAKSNEVVTGYIVVAATDLEHATTIAEGCPGLAHGVVVEVRPLEAWPDKERDMDRSGGKSSARKSEIPTKVFDPTDSHAPLISKAVGFRLNMSRRAAILATAGAAVAITSPLSAWKAYAETSAIVPFNYHAPQDALDDLKRRLANTRWPERETVTDWSQGAPLAKLRAFVEYWRTVYDWRRCEKVLNGFAQYRTEIDGLNIHFLHVRSRHENALPIVITHGWPGSVIEFFKIIDPLTNPTAHGGKAEDAFHVIAPSLPGFGFSDKPTQRGWNADHIAKAWTELVRRLGYTHYVAQGGDWGAVVTTKLAQQRPAGLAGIHLNFPQVFPNPVPTTGLSPDEQRAADAMKRFQTEDFGYFQLQMTRPQTIGYALADSPTGQAAWIYEQFHAWTDNNGDPESALTRDQMLDDITLYWLTDAAASSARMYFENAGSSPAGGVVDLPVGCSIFPRDVYRAPRSWAERVYPHLMYWHELDRGGHFAAFEQPALFTQELRACFRSLR